MGVSINQVSVDGRRLSVSSGDVTVAYVITLSPDHDATEIVGAILAMGPQFMTTLNQALLDEGLDYIVQSVDVGIPVIEVVPLISTTTTTTNPATTTGATNVAVS